MDLLNLKKGDKVKILLKGEPSKSMHWEYFTAEKAYIGEIIHPGEETAICKVEDDYGVEAGILISVNPKYQCGFLEPGSKWQVVEHNGDEV